MAKVVWSKEYAVSETIASKRYSVGLEFIGAEKAALDKIERYVAGELEQTKK
jgi:hypothetical protein